MKKVIFLYAYLILSLYLFGIEYTLDELTEMYNQNILTKEDYEILKKQMEKKGEREGLYLLKLNNRYVSNDFIVIERESINYLDLTKFIEIIGLKNVEKTEKTLTLYIGEELEKIEIELLKNRIYFKNKVIENSFLQENGVIFLQEDTFKELFLNHLDIDKQNLKITMSLSFTEPKDILRLVEFKKETLDKKGMEREKDKVVKGKREFLAPGYLKIKGEQEFDKASNEKSYKKDWIGEIDYQGAFLYGEFTGRYDLRNSYLGNLNLNYKDIWKGHTFTIENRRVKKQNNSSTREWGFSFYKDKGYFNLGEKVIIRENVPIGSRVELLYMGIPIEIKDDDNGVVTFDNELIKTDRTYELKIYTSDNRIYTKEIKPTQDYNRQAKNEIKYSVYINEDKYRDGKYRGIANIYYGITNRFTVGAGVRREIELFNDYSEAKPKNFYINYGNLETIYGGVHNGIGYTLKFNGEKAFSDLSNNEKSYRDNYTYTGLGELKYGKYSTTFSKTQYGKYHSQKEISTFRFKYDIIKNLRLEYNYDIKEDYQEHREKNSKIGLSLDTKYKEILFMANTQVDLINSDKNIYSIGAYYAGFQHMTIKLENRWRDSGKNYESILTLYNNNFKGLFDVSTELKYEKEKKDMISLRVTMKLDDLFTIGSSLASNGERNYKVGIDKVIDLKNPKFKLDNTDVSRANIIAFIDENGNDEYEENEKYLKGVEVTTGKQVATTNENGRATLYGLSNGMEHELNIVVKNPNYILNNEKIKVLSNYTSDIKLYVPVKPLINIRGKIEFDKDIKVQGYEKQDFYSNILIEVMDQNGKILELVAPDNTGYFDISGLIPEKYQLSVKYTGIKYNLPPFVREFYLSGKNGDMKKEIILKISKEDIELYGGL